MNANILFIDDRIADLARSEPNAPALDFCGEITTWAQLDAMVNAVAHRLRAEGVQPQDRIAFLARNSDYEIVVLFAVSRLHATFLPINWRLSAPEINWILDDAAARVVITSDEFLLLLERDGRTLDPRRRVIVTENRGAELRRPGDGLVSKPEAGPLQRSADPDVTPAVQIYTSGTTGRPKGTMLSHSYFIRGAEMVLSHPEAALRLDPGEQALLTMPLFHIGGLNYAFILMSQGRGLVVLPDYDVTAVLELIDKGRVALVTGVPTMLQALLDHPNAPKTDFSGLRYFMYGAAPMPPALVARAMKAIGCGFASTYGLTESSSVTYLAPGDHSASGDDRMRSVGRPLPGVEIRIVGPNGAPAPVDEVGEITVRSPQIMLGYWNQPEATQAAFLDGWLRTGDAGALDADGYLHLKDRIKDMIVSGGENIYPAEIERVIFEHPAVHDVAVVGTPDDYWGETAKAFVVPKEGVTLTLEELRAFAGARLARFKLPKQLELLPELPRTASGKVLKRALRDRGHD
jgi:long-chain acyl-CoA synthetase